MKRILPLLIAAACAVLVWWGANRPVEVPGRIDGKLKSVSFSPYRAGQSPLIRQYPSAEELEADLALVAGVAEGVRTYTSLEGFDRVPALAARHGLAATMGAWLTTDAAHNRREVEALIRVANEHPHTVQRVIVGNETLVRHEVTADQLIALLRETRARVRQPVSYADVPVVWHHYPQLAAEVDFLTVHVLPYWEDQAVPYAATRDYLREQVRRIRERFPGKPILIGESGWPADGRPRGPALPGRPEQAGYLRMLAETAAAEGFDYNVIEAFDQPWKGALEGLVGAHWGVFDFDRRAKYPPAGPVEPLPDWPLRAAVAILAATLALLPALRRRAAPGTLPAQAAEGDAAAEARAPRGLGAATLFGLACAAQALAALAVMGAWREWGSAFTPHDTARALVQIGLMTLLPLAALTAAVRILQGVKPRGFGCITRVLTLMALALALHHAWEMTFHGHLLDFRPAEVLVPAGSLALLVAARRTRGLRWREAAAMHALFGLDPIPAPAWMRIPARVAALALLAAALGVLGGEAFEAVRDDFGRDQALPGRLVTAWHWLGATRAANLQAAALAFLALPFLATAAAAREAKPGAAA